MDAGKSLEQRQDEQREEKSQGKNSMDDSQEEKAFVGKPEEMKLRKLMKQKLQTTSIPALEFEDYEGNVTRFRELYDYCKFLGAGSFGFVVSAVSIKTGEYVALKVSI